MDYTSDGIRNNQIGVGVGQLCAINKKLKKTNRYLVLISVIGVTCLAFKFKAFKEFIDMKGE